MLHFFAGKSQSCSQSLSKNHLNKNELPYRFFIGEFSYKFLKSILKPPKIIYINQIWCYLKLFTQWMKMYWEVVLREKCPHSEFLSVFSQYAGKYGPEILWIRTLFTQCGGWSNFSLKHYFHTCPEVENWKNYFFYRKSFHLTVVKFKHFLNLSTKILSIELPTTLCNTKCSTVKFKCNLFSMETTHE